MNGTYYQNPTFPASINNNYQEPSIPLDNNTITDILNNNIGKKVNVSINIINDEKIFSGIIESIKKDILIISNPETGNWYFILLKNLNYIEFEETINK